MQLNITIRKVYKKPAYNVQIKSIKDCGFKHDKQMIVHGSKSAARGQAIMFARNVSQKASVVNYPIFG